MTRILSRMALVAAVAAGLSSFGQSVRADQAAELARCRDMASGLERLACYDALVPPKPAGKEQTLGHWTTTTDVSRFDDTKSVYLSTDAREAISGWPSKRVTPSLHIRFHERKTAAYIVFGMPPAVETGHSGGTIQIRADKDPIITIRGSKSTDGEALFLPDAIPTLKKLFGKRELLVRFTPFNSSPQETSFLIEGLETAVGSLRETCGW